MFFAPLSKTPILQKSLFFLRKIAIFVGWSPHKSIKNRCKNDIKKNIEKKDSKIEFWPPCWPLKSSEIRPKSDAKRSLLRDVMELTRKSSQINGTHGLFSVQMARHMIRSTPSIHPCIHPLFYLLSP